MCVCAHTATAIVVWVFFVRLAFCLPFRCWHPHVVLWINWKAPVDRSRIQLIIQCCVHVLTEFNKMSTLWQCSGVRCVGACDWIWKHKITLHITGSGVRHREAATLSNETSQFFGPSPRKQRLTVYRGLQVTGSIEIPARFSKIMKIMKNWCS